MSRTATVFFHSPCFDGIASAAMAQDLLEQLWDVGSFDLRAVDYGLRDRWLDLPLPADSAVVDFLYHPGAAFFADHHPTTFLSPAVYRHFHAHTSPTRIFDDEADSCAQLLWDRHRPLLDERWAEVVTWASKFDAARYDNVEEAVLPTTPAGVIRQSLLVRATPDYCADLAKRFRHSSLEEVASTPDVVKRRRFADRLVRDGVERFRKVAFMTDDEVVVFDVRASDVIVSRYAPYLLYPQARYSVGIVRTHDTVKVTAMRNPWRDFESINLGELAARLGGGGHHRVGSVLAHQPGEAERVRAVMLDAIRATPARAEATQP